MTTKSDSSASPEALLKAAVSGGKAAEPAAVKEPAVAAKAARRLEPLTIGLAGAALALGTMLGAGTALLTMPRSDGGALALAEVNAGLEAARQDASRLATSSDRLDRAVAGLKQASDAARGESKAGEAKLMERIGGLETALAAKVAALSERLQKAEAEQTARAASVAALAEKHAAAPATPSPAPKAELRAEPAQTGSIQEQKAKPLPSDKITMSDKPSVIEGWAVRDVYDGTAMIEDRRRRLIEVAAGDSIPGVGRVEAVERRGRAWVVVTRQGVVTPQPW